MKITNNRKLCRNFFSIIASTFSRYAKLMRQRYEKTTSYVKTLYVLKRTLTHYIGGNTYAHTRPHTHRWEHVCAHTHTGGNTRTHAHALHLVRPVHNRRSVHVIELGSSGGGGVVVFRVVG